jgi:hypothetical protein
LNRAGALQPIKTERRVRLPVGSKEVHISTGSFGWEGVFGTTFRVDPKDEMTALQGVPCRKVPAKCATESSVVRTTAVTGS